MFRKHPSLRIKRKKRRRTRNLNPAAPSQAKIKLITLHDLHPKSEEKKIGAKRKNQRKGSIRKLHLPMMILKLIIPMLILVKYLPPKSKKLWLRAMCE
jgi:hypothetical protein